MTAPHFCAGIILVSGKIVDAAPILAFMRGWELDRVLTYVNEHKWSIST